MDMNLQKVSLLVLILFVLSCGSSEVEEHLSKAGDFRSQGEWQKEIEQYELALGSDKTNAEIWYLKAIALGEIGSEEDVLLSLNNAIKYLKSIWPNSIVIIGGNHATNTTTKLLQFPFIDYVGRGEAEIAFTEFVNCIAEKKKVSVKGIYSKMDLPENKKDQTVPRWIIGDGTFPAQNSDHLLDRCISIENLDDLPNPDWEILIRCFLKSSKPT